MGRARASGRRRPRRLTWPASCSTRADRSAARPSRGSRRLSGLRGEGTVPWTCAVNVEEIARGLRDAEIEHAQRLLAGLRLAPLGVEEALVAGTWRKRFSARGVTLSQADCLIAAAVQGVRAMLATGNPRRFPMRGIRVVHWPAGA